MMLNWMPSATIIGKNTPIATYPTIEMAEIFTCVQKSYEMSMLHKQEHSALVVRESGRHISAYVYG